MNSLKNVLKKCLIEQISSEYDFHELIIYTHRDILNSIKNGEKISFNLINPNQYKRALQEYMQYGTFVRFPENKIFDWKELVLNNIVLLISLTDIHGHSQAFPYEEFYDVFGSVPPEHEYDFSYAYDTLIEKYNMEDYVPYFSNGQPVLSDYGIEPLTKLAIQLIPQTKPEDIIITINRIMNVAHQRSDLSELFIEGGEDSHSMISNT